MAYIFTIIFTSKLVSVEMACLLGIQNEIQAVCKRSVRRTKILSSSLSQFLSWKLKIRRALFQFSTKKDDGNIIILIYHDIKELLLQFSNNEQSPGAHISNKKWVNDIAEATGNIKFARISAHTPAIQILKDTKHKGMPVSRGAYFK